MLISQQFVSLVLVQKKEFTNQLTKGVKTQVLVHSLLGSDRGAEVTQRGEVDCFSGW